MTNPAAVQPARDRRANSEPPAEFLEALNTLHRPILVGHVNPDADSLGACLGLAVVLRREGRPAVVVLPKAGISKKLKFLLDLAGAEAVTPDIPADADSAIILDTATAKRVNIDGGFERIEALNTLNIDHHITNPDYARHNWVDPHASSTSEMAARLVRLRHWRMPPAAASLLYAGIHGDTGGFSQPNTTADALHLAAELLRAGADVTHIGEQLCRSQGRHDFELLRRVYDHTRLSDDGLIAYSYLTFADIVESGCTAEDIDDQVSIPRALRGIRIAMLFTEGEPGTIRVNLRGEGRTSVIEVAEHFGGGGHAQSAGVRVRHKPMEQVIQALVTRAREHLAGQKVGP